MSERSERSDATPSHAERARTLAVQARTAALSTVALDPAGFPYGSLVAHAMLGPQPILYLSELAEHTRNLRADARASLMMAEPGAAEPLARGRVTLLGRCALVPDGELEAARAAYLAAHPDAERLTGFKDFHLWRLEVEALRFIGGFGRMSWVELDGWSTAEPDPLASHAGSILSHMNSDHADALLAYARAFSTVKGPRSARMTGVDRYGFELAVDGEAGPEAARIAFSRPLSTGEEVRQELIALVRKARAT